MTRTSFTDTPPEEYVYQVINRISPTSDAGQEELKQLYFLKGKLYSDLLLISQKNQTQT